MAEERGWFDFAAVADTIHEKLVRRHPHLFAGTSPTPQELVRVWEEQKAQERAQRAASAASTAEAAGAVGAGGAAGAPPGVLAGVPRALPALMRAAKLGARAARVGFDWRDAGEVRAKIQEELEELEHALAAAGRRAGAVDSPDTVADELGDLLFTVVNLSRHLEVDAESALRAANAKFERRFALMETLARTRGLELERLSAAEWDALWREAKLNPG